MPDKEILLLLEQIFRQAQLQFGTAIRSRWLHDADDCPGCGREIDEVKIKKKKGWSLNAFIFREHSVLIAYLLCGRCGKQVIQASGPDPTGTTPLHLEIEKNLKQAFIKHLGH